MQMKVAQTELSEPEYKMLVEYARSRGLTLKQALREGAVRLAMHDEVEKNDPIFVEKPVAKATGRKERTSVEHDKYLYGHVR
jgi:hypothetical protein